MIHHGDLFDVLPTFPADSIDAVITDPPYGIGYMGKEWDTFRPDVVEASAVSGFRPHPIVSDNPNLNGRQRSPAISPSQIAYDRSLRGQRDFQVWTERWTKEVCRVLKPGGYLLVCGAPRSFHRMTCGIEDAGFEIRDCLSWLYGQGFPKSLNVGKAVEKRTEADVDDMILWDGWGTALKPGWEPIVVARRPPVGTLIQNVMTYGTGGMNIGACRLDSIPSAADRKSLERLNQQRSGDAADPVKMDAGRWPANVLLDDQAAEVLDAETDRRPSRFYYIAKPSRAERDYGCEQLPERTGGEATDRQEGTAGLNNPRAGAGRTGGARNFHPTVKPLALMRWLVRLVTPSSGTVLDPFMGSGTTGMACRYEQVGFIGIEKEAEYIEIAKCRIDAVAPLFAGLDM